MADISITAANVAATGTFQKQPVQFGETVTAGQVVYLKSSDTKYWKAQADGTSEEASAAGICLGGAAANQYGVILTGGTITIGGTVVKGTPYFVSTTAGGICPHADLASTNYVTLIGFATSTAIISVSFSATGVTI